MKKSAGILLFRRINNVPEFFLVHPGGPYWQHKEVGAWSIPKGEYPETEDPLEAAKREFQEETGMKPEGDFIPLSTIQQKSGKEVIAWALEGDFDASTIVSNTFKMEYPYKSGKYHNYPEVDKGEWFNEATARVRINPAQVQFIDDLLKLIASQ